MARPWVTAALVQRRAADAHGTQLVLRVSAVGRAGQKLPLQTTNKPKEGLLTKANDWVLLVDFEHKKIVFPPHIYPTNQRPDIIFWSRMSRSVILLELTCCAEEGVKAAQLRKQVPRACRKCQRK